MRKKYTANILSFILIVVLSFTASPVCYAYRPLPITNIATLDQLVRWYNLPEAGLATLINDIEITQSLTLGQTTQTKGVNVYHLATNSDYTLRVMQGATLVIDNPKMKLEGVQEVITVENGGTLQLMRGKLYAGKDNAAVAIMVKKDGNITVKQGFSLTGVIKSESPDPPETPDQQPPPALPAIASTVGFDYSISCLRGEPPAASDYPATEWVTYETADNVPMKKELPVRWELDAVNFGVAGTYAIKGIFTAEGLVANGLSNPNNIYSTLQLTVLKPSALDTLTGNVLSVESEGTCLIRLAHPPLPEGATALYIHRSADGQNWQKAVQETYTNGSVSSSYDDFLPHTMITPTTLYVLYRYQTDYRPIYLRVEVVGSAVAGISNEIKLEMPSSAKPGDSTNTGETGDDNGSGGNRGGGGQSEGDREIPNVPTMPEQAQGGTIPPKSSVAGGISKGEPSSSTATQDGVSNGSPPASTPSDDKNQEGTDLSPLPKQETELAAKEVQALSGEVQGNPPLQGSRGVLLTAGATAFAAGALLLLRKLHIIRKRKP